MGEKQSSLNVYNSKYHAVQQATNATMSFAAGFPLATYLANSKTPEVVTSAKWQDRGVFILQTYQGFVRTPNTEVPPVVYRY